MNDSNKPVADLIALVERPNDRRNNDFVTIGALWLTERGHLMGKINAEPMAWRDPAASRQVMVRVRDGFQIVRASGGSSSRSYAGAGAPPPPRGGSEEPPVDDDIPFDPEDAAP